MTSFLAKGFVFLVEMASWIAIAIVGGMLIKSDQILYGSLVLVGGTIAAMMFFGISAIFIQIHRDLREIKGHAERYNLRSTGTGNRVEPSF